MTANSSLTGFPPAVVVGEGNPEAQKYGRMWEHPEYRVVAPGESLAQAFLYVAAPPRGSEVIDFGCGTGRGAKKLVELGGLTVTMLDFVSNSLDPAVREALGPNLKFLKHDLEKPIPVVARYGYATDVMEHIPAARVERVLENILNAAQHVFFSICTEEDRRGELIGETLHVTVRPYHWWLSEFVKQRAVIHWSQIVGENCMFYVSAWHSGREVVKAGVLNETEAAIRDNVAANIANGWEQVHPAGTNDTELVILGGGPSLSDFEAEIREKHAAGMKIVTLNGAYHWARERGIWPVNQMVVDARPFNARFTHPPDPACLYFIASQCHPSVLEGLPRERTFLYHCLSSLVGDLLDEHYGKGGWHAIPGGSSVLLRAIPLFRMLGFRRFHLYGCDSSLRGNVHHAYLQQENDGGVVVPVTFGAENGDVGRVFYAHPWMVAQATEFADLIRAIGDQVEIAVYGDGLLAYMLNRAAAHAESDISQPSAD